MQGANRQYRKVSGPAAEMKEGFIYSTEISTTGAAIAADTYLFCPVWTQDYQDGLDLPSDNAAEMVCRIFPSRDQEALVVFGYFYFLFELKPNLRGCVNWLWKEAE